MGNSCIIGISGPTASGKSFFTKKLAEKAIQTDLTVEIISTDHFYRDLTQFDESQRLKYNFDHPDAIDKDLFIQAINLLYNGHSALLPVYDFSTHTRTKELRLIPVSDLILVEGIFAFTYAEVLNLYDFKIYIELASDIRFIRRLQRDINERKRNHLSVITQYLDTVRPTQMLYVENDKFKADIVIYGDQKHEKIIDLVINNVINKKNKH